MERTTEQPGEPRSEAGLNDARTSGVPTRRAFLGDVGRKAAFVMPVVWTLAADQALAGDSAPSSQPSCLPAGQSCFDDTDCCSGNCQLGLCVP